ncbi:hypothetical protein PAXRUDRAFT_790802 [Paxillus rubicundulus Ve08.2h10]|uniref:Uncharacterized protein n=1 Tax=Paxillus rubicundulus Ve08.2h10 TaxID=930991 RepID=A0A0D0E5W0_9AGAM|nr:hypothetical protein PAXRUDRAFT_790802 [Paxillus rubicundulus Ve08.2h10]
MSDVTPSHSGHTLGDNPSTANPETRPGLIRRVILRVRGSFRTGVDYFGMCRHYLYSPSFEPDSFVPSAQLARACPILQKRAHPISQPRCPSPPFPFPNMTIYRLMQWMNTGSKHKSEGEITKLVNNVLLADDFDTKDLQGFASSKYHGLLDKAGTEEGNQEGSVEEVLFPDNWKVRSVEIEVPTRTKAVTGSSNTFLIPGFHYRSLVEVIRSAFSDVQAKAFHLWPFEQIWNDPITGASQRVFGELYTSDSWINAHAALQKQPPEPGCNLERVIVGLMFFSDATHLATFGNAKAWPLYLYFGNLSKYARAMPNSGACHIVGFFPSLPDNIKDMFLKLEKMSKKAIASLQAYCRRELFHNCWNILLDDEFLEVYCHGIVLRCPDGILRRVFPRIFTYSADYPEKVLIATIREMGRCPCPRCLVPKDLIHRIGTLSDMHMRVSQMRKFLLQKVLLVRETILKHAKAVDGSFAERTLGKESWVPIINAFVTKLSGFGLDPFAMLVVDFMHECELGTWKSLFSHLIRLLYALPSGVLTVAELDARFRQIPSFGRGTIRKFSSNTSEMKRLAARDFEDILQCTIPVVEGLFPPEHDRIVLALLYRFSEWHALAKLRLHTEASLNHLESAYKNLCQKLRLFSKKMCAEYHTTELPKEKTARLRKQGQAQADSNISSGTSGPRTKAFNMRTYKFHALGDYVRSIRLFGTTDSYTTQIGELAHRALKACYPLVSKKDTIRQLSKHEQRQRRLRRIDERWSQAKESNVNKSTQFPQQHVLPSHRHSAQDIFTILQTRDSDPAMKDFLPNLRNHLLHRLLDVPLANQDCGYSPEERNEVLIRGNMLFAVKTMQVHYTTYDLREEYDYLRLGHQCDVMVPTGESEPGCHPYWYARVLGIYHVDVRLLGGNQDYCNLHLLWVRWFGTSPGHRSGLKAGRLPKIGFVSSSDSSAFGFLDPSLVVRAAHLIPAFADGRGSHLLRAGKSVGRQGDEEDDWVSFYVNIFADRDMFMRFVGRSPGHTQPHKPPVPLSTDEPDNGLQGSDTEEEEDCDPNERDIQDMDVDEDFGDSEDEDEEDEEEEDEDEEDKDDDDGLEDAEIRVMADHDGELDDFGDDDPAGLSF